MHLLLTDRTTCPRCGPAFGLILLADRLEERRVVDGILGCANCRERYPIRGGVADLRPPPRDAPAARAEAGAPSPDRLVPLAAALGVGESRGHVLLLGATAGLAAALAPIAPPELEIVTGETGVPTDPGSPGVSRLMIGPALPFFDATFAGVGLAGAEASPAMLREAARVLARGHRVVVVDPPDDVQLRLGGAGLTRFVQGAGVAAGAR